MGHVGVGRFLFIEVFIDPIGSIYDLEKKMEGAWDLGLVCDGGIGTVLFLLDDGTRVDPVCGPLAV